MPFYKLSSLPPAPDSASFARYGAVNLEDAALGELGSKIPRGLLPYLRESSQWFAARNILRNFGVGFVRLRCSFLDDGLTEVEIFQILDELVMTWMEFYEKH